MPTLFWCLSSLPRPLEGAAFPGLSLCTPVPGFHRCTPVPDSLFRSPLLKVPDEAPGWIIAFAPCAKSGTVLPVQKLFLCFRGLFSLFHAPSVSRSRRSRPVLVPWSLFRKVVLFLNFACSSGFSSRRSVSCGFFFLPLLALIKEFFVQRALSPGICVWVHLHPTKQVCDF